MTKFSSAAVNNRSWTWFKKRRRNYRCACPFCFWELEQFKSWIQQHLNLLETQVSHSLLARFCLPGPGSLCAASGCHKVSLRFPNSPSATPPLLQDDTYLSKHNQLEGCCLAYILLARDVRPFWMVVFSSERPRVGADYNVQTLTLLLPRPLESRHKTVD
jgi:hypothetical protein